ncbi:MAG TPA: efflux RND transporter periplasmic adaptor subunit [Tepidisphaeraceae bacterium]|nr:efflux RND transporter periplasmic adaptor subunit [Tepidisphaeraceae bacterium]
MRTKGKIFAALAVMCGMGLAQGCKPDAGAGMQMPPPLVTTAVAISQDVPVYLDEIGRCSALESVTIRPQVAGRIVERHFEDGQELKKGQLLFTIDERPFKAALDSANAQLSQARAQVSLANIQLQMWSAVADTRAVSKSDFDIKKNAVDVANALVESAQAAVENAQINLDYCSIKSPIDGRAGQRLVDAGNIVEANTTSLLLIQRLDKVYADFTITERDLAEVQKQMALGTLKTLVRLPADPIASARAGDLTFLDNRVQDGTGTVKLRATIPNDDRHFWPGQFANIRLILMTQKHAVLVPNRASQISQQGPFVYVVKPDNTAELRVVELGQRQGDDVVVIKGVKAGERVVVAGQLGVRPGGPVRIERPADDAQPKATVVANN